jgi:hypothetical protein
MTQQANMCCICAMIAPEAGLPSAAPTLPLTLSANTHCVKPVACHTPKSSNTHLTRETMMVLPSHRHAVLAALPASSVMIDSEALIGWQFLQTQTRAPVAQHPQSSQRSSCNSSALTTHNCTNIANNKPCAIP